MDANYHPKPPLSHIPVDKSPIIASKFRRPLFPRKTLLVLLGLLGIVMLLAFVKYTFRLPAITTYDECIQIRGSLIRDSYPPSCIAPNGSTYTQIIAPTPTPLPVTDYRDSWLIIDESAFSLKIPPDWTLARIATQSAQTTFTFSQTATDAAGLNFNLTQINWSDTLDALISRDKRIASPSASLWQEESAVMAGLPAYFIFTGNDGYSIYTLHPNRPLAFKLSFTAAFTTDPQLGDLILDSFEFKAAPTPTTPPLPPEGNPGYL
jgi:hypothetical protein